MSFPEDFNWGSATSSYQIEGASKDGGRTPSIWDTFCATPGKVFEGHNGDLACDHYHRYMEDIQIMKDLGIQSYRFSLAWPRIIPGGTGARNQQGIDFYDRLIDALLDAGIQPTATLYHWDLPQVLQDKGGWANRDIVNEIADYATVAAESFGDRVANWVTINEPWCVTWLGYFVGVHAPGIKDIDQAVAAAHHTALAHAEITRALRAVRPEIRSGITLNMTSYQLDDPINPDLIKLRDLNDSNLNRWWLDAQLHGKYPENLVEFYGDKLERVVKDGDMEKLKVDSEFLGINYYSDSFISTPTPEQVAKNEGSFIFPINADGTSPAPHTDMGWPITPEGLTHLLVRVNKDWPEIQDIAITENGVAYGDEPDANGVVNDQRRVDYLVNHLDSVSKAISQGVPVKSYYYWSLLDNFEWAEGYAKRFGIVYVNFETLQRIPKLSASVYSKVISTNGLVLDSVKKN